MGQNREWKTKAENIVHDYIKEYNEVADCIHSKQVSSAQH
jgi:hypothetical protein